MSYLFTQVGSTLQLPADVDTLLPTTCRLVKDRHELPHTPLNKFCCFTHRQMDILATKAPFLCALQEQQHRLQLQDELSSCAPAASDLCQLLTQVLWVDMAGSPGSSPLVAHSPQVSAVQNKSKGGGQGAA